MSFKLQKNNRYFPDSKNLSHLLRSLIVESMYLIFYLFNINFNWIVKWREQQFFNKRFSASTFKLSHFYIEIGTMRLNLHCKTFFTKRQIYDWNSVLFYCLLGLHCTLVLVSVYEILVYIVYLKVKYVTYVGIIWVLNQSHCCITVCSSTKCCTKRKAN